MAQALLDELGASRIDESFMTTSSSVVERRLRIGETREE